MSASLPQHTPPDETVVVCVGLLTFWAQEAAARRVEIATVWPRGPR